MKLNIFEKPNLKIEDNLIDSQLINYDNNNIVNLASLQNENRPLIILAGSMT